VRTCLYSINSNYPLFLEDGVYDERLLGALDWIITVARAQINTFFYRFLAREWWN
jgi:hypothetical protein